MKDNTCFDQTFDGTDFTQEVFVPGEYENCTFRSCRFGEVNLSRCRFIDCRFTSCDLSMAKLNQTTFRDVDFTDCKMLGLRFDTSPPFGVAITVDSCQLDHASFYQVRMPHITFKKTRLYEVDFAECDLTGAVFDHCDLDRANFEQTTLEKADFRTAFNYTIDPEINKINQARFALPGVTGLLRKYNIRIEVEQTDA